MAFIQFNYYSEALKFCTDVDVIIPTPYDLDEKGIEPYFVDGCKYQVLYLLHGTYADHHDWALLSSITRYAQNHKLMVVMPSGSNSMWQDMYAGPKYFTFVTEELPKYINRIFPASDKREDTFIAGLSMGSFGALNLALRRPDRYGAAICLCGGMNFCTIADRLKADEEYDGPWPLKSILPPPYDGKGTGFDDEPILRELAASGKEIPRLFLAVGTEDFTYDGVQRTRKLMDELGVKYTYEEGPGVHNWVFWDEYIQHGLNWLNLKETTIK